MRQAKPPSSFVCPLTFEIMKDPVIPSSAIVIDHEGNSFEREAIERWLNAHHTSPITRTTLTVDKLATNRALRDAIEEWAVMMTRGDNEKESVQHADILSSADMREDANTDLCVDNDSEPSDLGPSRAVQAVAAEGRQPQQPMRSCSPALEKEEAQLRAKIMVVEERIGELLQHPLGRDGLGQRQVWRIKPSGAIWNEIVGDRTATDVVLSSAGAAVEGAGYVFASAVDRVVGWTYKPVLYSVYETARDASVGSVCLTACAIRAAYRGTTTVAGAVIETVDEHSASLDALQSELQVLSDRLAAIECIRSGATLRMLSPVAGLSWYTGHSCSLLWQSSGTIRNLKVYLRGRFALTWQEIGRDVADSGSWTFTLPTSVAEGCYAVRLEGPGGAVSAVSGFFDVKRNVPHFMLWVANQRSQYAPGSPVTISWRLRLSSDDETGIGSSGKAHAPSTKDLLKAGCETCWGGGGGSCQESGEDTVKVYLAPQLRWWRSLVAGLPTSSSFLWSVPIDCPPGTYCLQAKVKGPAGVVKHVSPVVYISVADEVHITSPPPGAAVEWCLGRRYTVAWSTQGAPRLDVTATLRTRLSLVRTLAAGQAESASLEWDVDSTLAPGWYYITVADTGRRIVAHSDWIHIVPPPPELPAQNACVDTNVTAIEDAIVRRAEGVELGDSEVDTCEEMTGQGLPMAGIAQPMVAQGFSGPVSGLANVAVSCGLDGHCEALEGARLECPEGGLRLVEDYVLSASCSPSASDRGDHVVDTTQSSLDAGDEVNDSNSKGEDKSCSQGVGGWVQMGSGAAMGALGVGLSLGSSCPSRCLWHRT